MVKNNYLNFPGIPGIQPNTHRGMPSQPDKFGEGFGCAPAFPWEFWYKPANKGWH
jgi:hypothetical protein